MILDTQPVAGHPAISKKFAFERLAAGLEILHAEEFSEDHIRQRRERDHLFIYPSISQPSLPHLNKCICVDILNTHTDVTILDGKVPHHHRNVLVCINLLELGIEIVKVLEYGLDDKDCILDGEIIKRGANEELLRLPVALISHDYLASAFASHHGLNYVGATQPSVEAPPIPEEEIHIFPFDAERRRNIALGKMTDASEWEKRYYTDWLARFGPYFFDEDGQISNSRAHNLFTPTSAKIMTYFFANFRPRSAG